MPPKRQLSVEAFFDPTPAAKRRRVDKDKEETRAQAETEWPKWVLEAGEGEPPRFRVFPPIKETPMPAVQAPGSIRVLKIYTRFAKVPDPSCRAYPRVDGYKCYNVCKNRSPYHTLSPMMLGPVHDESGELFAHNIEDGWQCCKVWPFHRQQGDNWLELWGEWSRRGRFSRLAKRHRTPKAPGQQTDAVNRNVPLFSLYMGDEMDYVTARKRMYCRWYEELVQHVAEFRDLRARYLSGQKLILLDYDGLDRLNPAENVDLTPEKLRDLVNDGSRPFGHGLVLAATLMGCPVWRE